MKNISVTDFKAHCLKLLSEVARTGEGLVLTRRGKPTAVVMPPQALAGVRCKPGQFVGTAQIKGDIVAPLDVEWEALG